MKSSGKLIMRVVCLGILILRPIVLTCHVGRFVRAPIQGDAQEIPGS